MSLLREMGYTRLRHYHGGIAEWIERGGEIEKGPGRRDGSTVQQRAPVRVAARPARGRPQAAAAASAASAANARRGNRAGSGVGSGLAALIERLGGTTYTRLLLVWICSVVGFALLYWAAGFVLHPALVDGGTPVAGNGHGFLSAVYFSFVTATTIGYGDVVPEGPVRALAVLEGALGLILFGSVISKLISSRQERLVEEIHRLSFDDHLGRVGTNLHLVHSELRAIAAECAARGYPAEQMVPRVEGAALIFSGEMRAIHDLLYGAREVPEEAEMEALLASLAGALREFGDLLVHFPPHPGPSAILEGTIRSMRRLAVEICGECVPRAYAPDLRERMDRVQELAGRLHLPGWGSE